MGSCTYCIFCLMCNFILIEKKKCVSDFTANVFFVRKAAF